MGSFEIAKWLFCNSYFVAFYPVKLDWGCKMASEQTRCVGFKPGKQPHPSTEALLKHLR